MLQPFGKRSGSKADNRVLYPNTMLAMARVVKPVTGRAVVLTYDKTSMFKVGCVAAALTEFPIPSFIEIFRLSFREFPPACGPLLQLATAQSGQGNSQNKK